LWSQNASQFTLTHLGRISTGADPQRLKLELTIGQSVNAISAQLSISHKTVSTHKARLLG